MSYSAHVLGWGFAKFKDAYQAAGQLDMMYDMLRTPLDYFLKCWIPGSQTYYVQVCIMMYERRLCVSIAMIWCSCIELDFCWID
jgi:hypothetical protein